MPLDVLVQRLIFMFKSPLNSWKFFQENGAPSSTNALTNLSREMLITSAHTNIFFLHFSISLTSEIALLELSLLFVTILSPLNVLTLALFTDASTPRQETVYDEKLLDHLNK